MERPRGRRRRPGGPAQLASARRNLTGVLTLLALLLTSLANVVHGHDQQQLQQVVVEPVPQDALNSVLEEEAKGGRNEYMEWFSQRLRENSLSQFVRNRLYEDEIEKLNPTCAVIGFLLRTVPVCPVVRKLQAYFLSTPPSLNKFFANALQPTHEMNQYLPKPLAKYPGDLPQIIDEEVADAERHTIYWYYALVAKAWQHMADILIAPENGIRPQLVFADFPDWQFAEGWTTGRLIKAHTGPFAVTIHRDGHLVILMRGSTMDEDWESNFFYPFCDAADSAAAGIPGRVHNGFLRYVVSITAAIDEEMARVRPWKVTLAGDSLGGAVANIMGVYLARKYEAELKEKVEVIAIGTPRVGDDTFSAYYRMHVNGRSPAFMGQGIRFRGRLRMNMVWEIGDFVVQVPWDCFPVPDCINGGNETYLYAHHGGMVRILPRMMPNADNWIRESNWIGDLRIGFKGMVATHMCSYWCWATTGLVPYEGTMCYFPGDKNHHGPPSDICLGQKA